MRGSDNKRKKDKQHFCLKLGSMSFPNIARAPPGGAGVCILRQAGGMQLIAQKQEPAKCKSAEDTHRWESGWLVECVTIESGNLLFPSGPS